VAVLVAVLVQRVVPGERRCLLMAGETCFVLKSER
jgi:hypothetical protein